MLFFSDPFFCFQLFSSVLLAIKEAFFFSIVVISISYLILPITQFFNKIFSFLFPHKLSWNLSTIMSFISLILGFILLFFLAFNLISVQVSELFKIITDQNVIENLINQVNYFISYIISAFNNSKMSILRDIFDSFDPSNLQILNSKKINAVVVSFIGELLNSFNKTGQSIAFLYVISSLYFSASFHIIREWNEWPIKFNKIGSFLTTGNSKRFHFFINYFSEGIKNWIIGQTIVSSIMSIFYSFSFSLLGILSPIPIGILFGFAPFIPYLGDFLSVFLALISLVYSNVYFLKVIFLLVIIALGHVLGGHILGPILIGNQVGINPIQGIIGFIVYSQIFGFRGIFLGIPISVFINSLLASYFQKEKRDFQNMQIMPDDY